MRRFFSVLLAVALALAIAAPVAAVESSGSTTVTVTVEPSISLSGVPATIGFGSLPGGANATSAPFTLTIVSNVDFNVTAQTAGLSSGADTIAPDALSIPGGIPLASTPVVVPMAPGADTVQLTLSIAVPGTARAGTYTGTVTWTAASV